jgi:hypothetical protein
VAKPGEPALPLAVVNVTPNDARLVLRGIGYRGGTYVDAGRCFPFTGAATTESRGVHVSFLSPVDLSQHDVDAELLRCAGRQRRTQLLVTPVQHHVASVSDGTSTQRKAHGDESAALLQRQSEPGRAVRCAIDRRVDAQLDASGVAFSAQVVGDPAAAIHQVWVTYTAMGPMRGLRST